MNTGDTYKVTTTDGGVFTGQFSPGKDPERCMIGSSLIWYDDVEAIEPIKYSYTPSENRSQRGIGVPRG